MIHLEYLRPGTVVDLPEVAGHTADASPRFEVLGAFAGGMGLCVHLRQVATGVAYALKGVRPDLIESQALMERFSEELRVWLSASACSLIAEALAVVRVNEHPCVLAPWMPHGDLASALPRFSTQQKFETAVRITRGLGWAYENLGIIHRDMKPPNVLLDELDLAYVSDWGLARPIGRAFKAVSAFLSPSPLQRPDRTEVGSFIGTVTYAAPEQLLGSPSIDHRADIYALGCMFFEFETGHPPFGGTTPIEIAQQHLGAPPPRLGGWLRRTALGLEDVVARCLQKDPAARYATYTELDEALVGVARKKGFSLDRCLASTRYARSVLGKGAKAQAGVLSAEGVRGRDGYVIVDFDDVLPFLEEAESLIALRRFSEAEVLLRPHFIPEFLKSCREWHFGHTVAMTYGYCLLNIGGQLKEGIEVFRGLDGMAGKPAEFYVNYSSGLLRSHDWENVCAVCSRGLEEFPDDLDLLGNQTLGLMSRGLLDAAFESARRRLHLRRDVHSIEEAVLVLGELRDRDRNTNLPAAISMAKEQWRLIREGLMLNPRYSPLLCAEIRLVRFAHDPGAAAKLCSAALATKDLHRIVRETAFVELLEVLVDSKQVKKALERMKEDAAFVSDPVLSDRLTALRMRIYARHSMVGRETPQGERIFVREVVDYYLPDNRVSDRDPVVTAEVLDWMCRENEALEVLSAHLKTSPGDWEARKTMALILQRSGRLDEAVGCARTCTEVAPWRAESYDCLAYVAEKAGLADVAREAKRRGNEVFDREQVLFEQLRTAFEAS